MPLNSSVLVIDDNIMNINIAQDLLEHSGMSVFTALDALNGIRLMKEKQPSLVLLDLLMPKCDGFETLDMIKQDAEIQNIPILAFTALASVEDKNKAMQGGCEGVILKPINTETFVSTIKEHIVNYLPKENLPLQQSPATLQVVETSHYNLEGTVHPILIVDDNPINLDILKEATIAMGHSAHTALSGKEALNILTENKVDLILVDLMMPQMDGYELLGILKKSSGTQYIPVIIVSAIASTEGRVEGFSKGAQDYITKPFEITEVQARIASVLHSKELQNELSRRQIELECLLTSEHEIVIKLEDTLNALKESEERFRMMADSSPVIIWMFNPDLEITYYNTSALKFCGFMPSRLKPDLNWKDSIFPDDLAMLITSLQNAVQSKRSYSVEYRMLRHDGVYRWMASQGNPRVDPHNQLIGFIASSVDIHDQKMAHELLEKRVQERTVQLVNSNKELEAFSYTVSHDLRAPLRSINGFSQALVDAYDSVLDDEGKDYLARIRRATLQMGMLIDEMLKLFQLSRTELVFEESVPLSRIVQEIVENHVLLDVQSPVHYSIQPNVNVKGDRRLLQAVLQNLLDNAWKFSSKSESATIEFGHTENKGENIYFIKDNGVGFNMDYVDKLFGVFQRLHSSIEYPGNGIGLANCARIIHRHGGRIWAESLAEKGASFFFTLSHECEKLPLNQSFNSQVSV